VSPNNLRHTEFVEQLLKFAAAVHLHSDVTATDELTTYKKLGDRRPVINLLNAFADIPIGQYINGLVLDPVAIKNMAHLGGKTAHWLLFAALHIEKDGR